MVVPPFKVTWLLTQRYHSPSPQQEAIGGLIDSATKGGFTCKKTGHTGEVGMAQQIPNSSFLDLKGILDHLFT
jgi:hypothetical protein